MSNEEKVNIPPIICIGYGCMGVAEEGIILDCPIEALYDGEILEERGSNFAIYCYQNVAWKFMESFFKKYLLLSGNTALDAVKQLVNEGKLKI